MSRRKILERDFPRVHNPVSTVDIGCSDRRIKGSRGLVGECVGDDEAIPITIPGGIKDLVDPKDPRDRECLLEKIALFAHDLMKIRARMHNECVACGRQQDLDYYEDMLLKAGVVLRGRFPWVEVVLVIVDFDACYLVEKDDALVGAIAG
jgi:hypothetical protein